MHVVSRERPEQTVSLGAGAIWEFPPVRAPQARPGGLPEPPLQYKIEPQEAAKRWCAGQAARPPRPGR